MTLLKYDPTRLEQLSALLRSREAQQTLDPVTIKKFVVGRNQIFEAPAILNAIAGAEVRKVLIVSDDTPIRRGSTLLRELVSQLFREKGVQAETLILKAKDPGPLRADMEGVSAVEARIKPGAGLVGVGAGTISDICKYAAFLYGNEGPGSDRPLLLICQTATSGSAFGSNQAVIFKDGVKRTLRALYPDAVVADMQVLVDAPRPLNLAGFADMKAILVSSVDWHISHLLEMSDSYSEFVVDIMNEAGQVLLEIGPSVGTMSPHGLETLAKILVLLGIVSSMGYGTTPISGFEHMISHALDMESLATGRLPALHGAQVGVGLAYASVAYHFFLHELSPQNISLDQCYPPEAESHAEVMKCFHPLDPGGRSTQEIWDHYREKLLLWEKRKPLFKAFLAQWASEENFRENLLKKLKRPEEIISSLCVSGNPVLPEDLSPAISADLMRFAFLSARFMRNRFIIADMIGFQGSMNDRFWRRVNSEVRRITKDLRSQEL